MSEELHGGESLRRDGDMRVPVPDPTTLTTLQLDQRIIALERLIFIRLDAMDKALLLFHENITRVPTDTDKQIQHLRELQDEKFRGISLQFAERDTRAEQSSRDSKVAVDAALQAAKEAVGEQNKSSALAIAKSETATAKQIDQLGVLIQGDKIAMNDKIDDIKSRLTLIEGKGFGTVATQLGHNTSSSFVVSIVVAGIALVALVMSVVKAL